MKDHGEDFLVGNAFSWADIQLLEAILMVEELDASVLSDFPLLKVVCFLTQSQGWGGGGWGGAGNE